MLIRHAAIQLALSPIGKLVSHSDVKRLLLHDKVSKAESMIRQIRDLAKDQSAECLGLVHEWERAALLCLLEKRVPGMDVKETLEAQAALLTWKVRQTLGVNLTNEWDSHLTISGEGAGSSSSTGDNAGLARPVED